jgi:hypothetical protein
MDYVVRTLDTDGKLKKERLMFYSVRILDKDGILKKVVKEKLLSEKYWESFSSKPGRIKAKKSNINFRSNATKG